MTCFVDTSAFFALLDRGDVHHPEAKDTFVRLLQAGYPLLTSNYVMVESFALLQRRIGLEAVRAFQSHMVPILRVEFVTADLHRRGVSALLSAGRRQLSLVDCVSFEMMRSMNVIRAFAFDGHFLDQGFEPAF